MKILEKNGVFIRVIDLKKEGYGIIDRHGNFKVRKYGLLDKIHDVFSYGRTLDIAYYYIYFFKDAHTNQIMLEISGCGDELSKLLTELKKSHGYRNKYNLRDYKIINEYEVEYYDKNHNKNKLSFNRFDSSLVHHYFNTETKKMNTETYDFYSLE